MDATQLKKSIAWQHIAIQQSRCSVQRARISERLSRMEGQLAEIETTPSPTGGE